MGPSKEDALARLLVLRYVVGHAVVTPPGSVLKELFRNWPAKDCQEFDEECKAQAEATIAKMREQGLWRYTSPKERAFLKSYGSKMDEYARLAAGWRIECAGMIMWALGRLDSWPKIDEEFTPDLFNEFSLGNVGLAEGPELRPEEEISERRDLIEFWHWRVRTRQLMEEGRPLNPDDKMKRTGFRTFDDIVRFSARKAHEDGLVSEIVDEDFRFLGKAFRSLLEPEYHLATSIIMERHQALNWLCGLAPDNQWDETPTDT